MHFVSLLTAVLEEGEGDDETEKFNYIMITWNLKPNVILSGSSIEELLHLKPNVPLFLIRNFYMLLIMKTLVWGGGSPYDVMAYILDCDKIVSKFKLLFSFRLILLRKVWISLSPNYRLNTITTVDGFGIK